MQTLVRELDELTAPLGGRVGIAARDLRNGEQVMLHADEPYPLASVFKIPVMVEVLRQVDRGAVRLDERIELHEQDKSPGGILLHLHDGLSLTVLDLLYFMITQSDNIATDLLWRRIGLDSVNSTMHELGLDIDCSMPDREYFLLEVGACPSWRGLHAEEIVRRVRATRAAGRMAELFAAVLDEARDLDGARFQQLYDERFGLDGSDGFDHAFVIDQALDNTGSPAAMAELLSMIAGGRCATGESCRLMERIMLRQEWRQRIPMGLPAGQYVANKTGSVAGTVNDAAIVRRADGSELVLVVFARGLDQQASERADSVIADVAAAVWRRLG
jgi:beta-lactamase class A